MNRQIIDPELVEILACPVCKSGVGLRDMELVCTNDTCRLRFLVVDGIPIMLPPSMSGDLALTRRRWDTRYESQTVKRIDLGNEPETRDALVHIKKNMRTTDGLFLEVGSGFSKVSCALAKEGTKTTGIDISLSAIKGAKELFEIEGVKGFLVNGDILHMPFRDNSFSFMYAGGTIEHFDDTEQCVKELFRCLKPGGLLTATIPCISLSTPYIVLRGNIPDLPLVKSITEVIHLSLLKGRYMQFGYEKSFTPRRIKKVFNDAGFCSIQIGLFETYYPLTMFRYKFVKKMLTRLAKLRPFWPMIYINGSKGIET